MKQKRLIIVSAVLVLALASAASAQNLVLSGTVFDTNGITPVQGALVKATVEGSPVGQNTTDSSGNYMISFPDSFPSFTELNVELFAQKGAKHSTTLALLPKSLLVLNATLQSHPQCSDLIDNDNDGYIDYPDDAQCQSPDDDSEKSVRLAGGRGRDGPVLGIGVKMETEDFAPLVWMSPERRILHNRADGGTELVERVENYAFEGEQIVWDVIVLDKNGADKIKDVYITISGSGQQAGDGSIEANCNREGLGRGEDISEYNARILEERITTFNPDTMAHYKCIFTVEPYDSMYGEYFVTVEAEDVDGNLGTFDENEYWFLNPVIALEVVGSLDFGTVRPGSNSYSDTLLIRNDADAGSGVLLNMFISGTDFYDPDSSGAKCPTSNILSLQNLAYFATNGNYATGAKTGRMPPGETEGYYWIPYENGNEDGPFPGDDNIYGRQPIIEGPAIVELGGKKYYAGNVLSPGAELAITFRLSLPEPCNGDFSDGQIYFWGEAI